MRVSKEFKDTRYCGSCGSRLVENTLQGYKRCLGSSCGKRYYDNPKVGVSVIYIENGKILLGKRNGSYKRGSWCIPCGYLENEDIEEGARREFREETSLDVGKIGLYKVVTNPYHDKENILSIYYEVKDVKGDLKAADDLDEVRFYGKDELPEIAFTIDKEVIDELVSVGKVF